MKLKFIHQVFLGSLGFTLGISSSMALVPSAINPQSPGVNDVVIHYAGATAQSETVKALAGKYCDLTTKDEYNNVATDPTHFVVSCKLKSVAPVPSSLFGKNLYFSYHLNGGSIYGVTPVADQLNLPYMKVFGGSCAGGVSPSTAWKCANTAAFQYQAKPVAGGSDVEPDLFVGSNTTGLAFGPPSAAGKAQLIKAQAFNVVFGIALNNALLDGAIYPGGTGTIKSLSKSSIATIFSGTKSVWDAIPEYGNMNNFLLGIGATTNIHVCRRKAGSGTQAAAQVYFLGQECSAYGRPFVTASSAPIAGEVEEISSSTKILTDCVNLNPRSIGISSLEKVPGPANGSNWNYVHIDGIAPTLENAAKGIYDYMYENSIQYHNTAINANQKTFILDLIAEAKAATTLSGLPGVLGVPDGVINIPADTSDTDSDGIVDEFLPSNPVAWTSRGGLACSVPTQIFP